MENNLKNKMKNQLIWTISILLLFSACGRKSVSNANEDTTSCYENEDSLYTYKNLTILLIRGEDELSRNYLTLEEAMEQKKVTLHETGNVGELSVDNTSSDYVFIMAGDIVKGGRQDRTISENIVLPHGQKKVRTKYGKKWLNINPKPAESWIWR